MNGLLNYFMPGEVGGMPTMNTPQTGLGGYFNNPLAIAGLTMLAANRGPNQAQAIPLGLQALQGQQRFNLMQQQAEEEKKQRDEERRLRALERARLEEARAAQERVLPEMLTRESCRPRCRWPGWGCDRRRRRRRDPRRRPRAGAPA